MSNIKTFKTFLNEEARLKHGLFIFGKSASGKSTLSRTLSSLFHIPIVDSDHFYEPLLFRNNVPLDFSKHTEEHKEKSQRLRSEAIEKSREEWNGYIKRNLSFIYTGLGNQIGWVDGIAHKYMSAGYQIHIIYVDVTHETSKQRNQTRERKLPDHLLDKQATSTHEGIVEDYKDLVGDNNFLYVNNEKSYDIEDIISIVDRWLV
jgi:dephospho-CoA kinase